MPEDAESFLGVESQSQSGGSPSAVPPPLQSASSVGDSAYRGYGGWLAFFCILQIFVNPIVALISLAVSVSSISEVSDRYPGLIFITLLEFIGTLGVVGFGVYAGIMLRRVRPGAVRIAKRYVLTALLWSFLALALPYMGGDLPSRVTEGMMLEAVKGLLRTLFGFAIWYSYFHVSKRVKATFPEG